MINAFLVFGVVCIFILFYLLIKTIKQRNIIEYKKYICGRLDKNPLMFLSLPEDEQKWDDFQLAIIHTDPGWVQIIEHPTPTVISIIMKKNPELENKLKNVSDIVLFMRELEK